MTRSRWRHPGAVAALVLVPVLAGCAGPTPTDSALRAQASTSAQTAVSELLTVDLAARTQLRSDAWWSFTDVTVSASEDALSSVADTFASRQPSSARVLPLYRRTSALLTEASDLATTMRVAVRRHDVRALTRLRHEVPPLVRRLTALGQATS